MLARRSQGPRSVECGVRSAESEGLRIEDRGFWISDFGFWISVRAAALCSTKISSEVSSKNWAKAFLRGVRIPREARSKSRWRYHPRERILRGSSGLHAQTKRVLSNESS